MPRSEEYSAEAVAETIEDLYPLSPLQRGLLFHLLRDPDGAEYLSQFALRVYGADPTAVADAWQLLARRHPVLRTGFLWEGLDEPVQAVYRSASLPLTIRDLRGLPEPEREQEVAHVIREDRCRGFRPDDTPPARLTLLHLSDDTVHVVWTHHVILLDGWSTGLLFADLERIAEAMAGGTAPPPLSGPRFGDYVRHLSRRDPAGDAVHWRSVLAGVAAATPLPLAERRGEQDHGGAQHEILLSRTDSERVRQAARRLRVPFGVWGQAAWALTLARYAGLSDVVFGLVVSGRTAELPGVEQVVGALTNTVPVRVRMPAGQPVAQWLRGLAEHHAGTLAHEHSPLTEVRRYSDVPGGRPLFETVLVIQNLPLPEAADAAASGRPPARIEGYESTHYPMALFLVPGDQIAVRVAYRRGVVGRRSAELVADCVRTALVGLADSSGPLDSVPVFTGHATALAVPGQGPEQQWGPAGTLPEVFAGVVAAHPDAVAVAGDGAALTYRELDRRAVRLAAALRRCGAGVESRVGVLLERSADSVTAMLGVLRAGAGYVPVDPAYPAARIAYLLSDSACQVIVTRSGLRHLIPAAATARVVLVDEPVDGAPDDGARGEVTERLRPDNLAYVIYTSGSTGAPKGVVVTHRAVLNTLRSLAQVFEVGPGEVVAHKNPVGFTDALFETLWPLCHGATVSIVDSPVARDPDAYAAELRARGVTYTQLVPRHIEAIATGARHRGAGDPLPGLKWAVNAAEALPASFVSRWDTVCEQARVANIYGMTESAIFATCQLLPRGLAARSGTAPIGVPLPNVTARVLNQALEPCPPGVPGELYLGGVGIARGYLGRAGLTADRFVPDPLGSCGDRLYRTGDLVRWLPEGTLDYLGRSDFQVKVRGMRVEPGEVEATLREHPAVRDAVVSGEGGRLAGYLVPAGSEPPTTGAVRDWLAQQLPEHLVPVRLAWLDELPMTAHGKVDRDRLPALPADGGRRRAPVPPRTAPEQVLAQIWAEVLGVDQVGAFDDFFALGGDSMLAVLLVGRVREVFPVDYTVGALFDAPSLAGSAELVAGLLDAAGEQIGQLLSELEDLPDLDADLAGPG